MECVPQGAPDMFGSHKPLIGYGRPQKSIPMSLQVPEPCFGSILGRGCVVLWILHGHEMDSL